MFSQKKKLCKCKNCFNYKLDIMVDNAVSIGILLSFKFSFSVNKINIKSQNVVLENK
jgi:hypothetical protein